MGITAGLLVGLRGMVPAALAGLALAYVSQLSGMMQYVVRVSCETESRFTAVQRMHTLLRVNWFLCILRFTINVFTIDWIFHRLWKAKVQQLWKIVDHQQIGPQMVPSNSQTLRCVIGPIYRLSWKAYPLILNHKKRLVPCLIWTLSFLTCNICVWFFRYCR